MQYVDPDSADYSPFHVEKAEMRTINGFADSLDAYGFVGWLGTRHARDRYALVCSVLGYGCEYNRIDASIESFSENVQPVVKHMKTSVKKISTHLGFDSRYVFNYLRGLPQDAFEEVARWAILFYGQNNNWRKFPDLQL